MSPRMPEKDQWWLTFAHHHILISSMSMGLFLGRQPERHGVSLPVFQPRRRCGFQAEHGLAWQGYWRGAEQLRLLQVCGGTQLQRLGRQWCHG